MQIFPQKMKSNDMKDVYSRECEPENSRNVEGNGNQLHIIRNKRSHVTKLLDTAFFLDINGLI